MILIKIILSIDFDWFDLDVLKLNNWIQYKPKSVIAEGIKNELGMITSDPVLYPVCNNR